MAGMTTLEAINICLVAVNEFRVDQIDTNGVSTAADAERYINESTRYFVQWAGLATQLRQQELHQC